MRGRSQGLTGRGKEGLIPKTEVQPLTFGEKQRSNWRTALDKAHAAPRCTAKSKRTGLPCRQAAVNGWRVCRMHGAGGGAPKGNKNRLVHGYYSAEAVAERRETRELIRSVRDLVRSADIL